MADKETPVDKLTKYLGFDPRKKSASLTNTLLQDVINDITKVRIEEAKTKAKEYLTKGVELVTQFEKAKAEFRKLENKFEAELGGLMKQLQSMTSGGKCTQDDDTCAATSNNNSTTTTPGATVQPVDSQLITEEKKE